MYFVGNRLTLIVVNRGLVPSVNYPSITIPDINFFSLLERLPSKDFIGTPIGFEGWFRNRTLHYIKVCENCEAKYICLANAYKSVIAVGTTCLDIDNSVKELFVKSNSYPFFTRLEDAEIESVL